jgi:CheY-like chemotaxis protein
MELALGNSFTVLVVDHDRQVRTFIERSLRLTGASAILCASAFEGLHAIEHAHLIMLDLVMPDQDSYEFLHRREKPSHRDRAGYPAIVVMGPDCLQTGADFRNPGLSYLPKPFTQIELIDAIVKSISKRAPLGKSLSSFVPFWNGSPGQTSY